MSANNKLLSAIVSVVLGVLLIIMQKDVISFALTLIGIALIVSAVMDFSKQATQNGIIKAVIGAVIIAFGWLFVSAAVYILAAILVLQGILQIVDTYKLHSSLPGGAQKAFSYSKPVISLLAGICLLFNQGGTISWVFIVCGILLVAEGVIALAGYKSNPQ